MRNGKGRFDGGFGIILVIIGIATALISTSCGPGGNLNPNGSSNTPTANLSPDAVTIPNQLVGVKSAVHPITLTNSGDAPLTITKIAFTGPNPGDFSQTNSCGKSLAAGAYCKINVIFKPTAKGVRSASLNVNDGAASGDPSVEVTGTGVTSGVSLSPTSVAFTGQAVGVASAAKAISLTNAGSTSLTITSIVVSGANAGDFAQSNNCGSTLAAGAHCSINVTFKPSAAGTRSAAITVTDNASGSPQTATLSGTSASAAGGVSLSPSALVFSGVPVKTTSTAETVTLTNNTSAAVSISSFNISGTNSSEFVQNNNCPSSVAAGASCKIVVLFTPTAAGARSAKLSVADNATGSPQTVSFSGNGGHDVLLSWTASPTPSVVGYNIYRGTKSGGESATPLNATPVDGTDFTDDNVVAGAEYFYTVTSVTSDGVTESAESPETDALIPTP